MKKFLRQVILFIVAFCIIQFLCNILFLKKIGIPYGHNKRFTTQYQYYKKEESAYNTVFLGSSRTYRQINPLIIDTMLDNRDIRSFNLGALGTFHPETFFLFEQVLERKSGSAPLRYVFMELTDLVPIEFVNWFAPQSYYYIDAACLRFALDYFFSYPGYKMKHKVKYAYPFVQGYLLNHLFLVNPLYATPEKEVYLGEYKNGFYPLDLDGQQNKTKSILMRQEGFRRDTTGLTNRKLMQEKKDIPAVNQVYLARLKEMLTFAEQHQVELYFIIPPRLKEYSAIAQLKSLLPADRVIDMGSHVEYPDLYLVKNSFDIAHLNSAGAELYSMYLAKAIQAKLFSSDAESSK